MGNRAVITTENGFNKYGLYVHWNGGRATIKGLLNYMINEKLTYESDLDFLNKIQLIYKHCFSNRYEVSIFDRLDLDNGDNGVYILDRVTFRIIGRVFNENTEQDDYDLNEMTSYIETKMKEYEFLKSHYMLNLVDLCSENYISYKIDIDKNKVYIEKWTQGKDNPNTKRHKEVEKELRTKYKSYIKFIDKIKEED